MCTFCRWLENRRVFGCFDSDYAHVLRCNVEFGHAMGTSEKGLSWNQGCIRKHSWLVEFFLATLVRTPKFFLVPMRMENLQSFTFAKHVYWNRLYWYLIKISNQAHNTNTNSNQITVLSKLLLLWTSNKLSCNIEPRAGLDPAACCLRGSRSTGLSYRGLLQPLNQWCTRILKSSAVKPHEHQS